MANSFASGAYLLPTSQFEVKISGLALDFTPDSVSVSVVAPSGDSDFITAALIAGTTSKDGFTVSLSAPLAEEGYLLNWIAVKGAATLPIVAGDTLSVSYDELMENVARFLGYDYSNLTEDQTRECDSYVQSGVRQVYMPPAYEGIDTDHEWSFLRQEATVNMTAGVTEYALPTGFGSIISSVFASQAHHLSVPVVPYEEVQKMLAMRPDAHGEPLAVATMYSQTFGARGQNKKLIVFPAPETSRYIQFTADADTGRISAENPFPLGGHKFSELYIESCLAIAEQRANDEKGIHTDNFTRLIIGLISKDRRQFAQEFGQMGDQRYTIKGI